MIELNEGTDVFTQSGEQVGKVNRFVMDPATQEVTHIIVQKGWLFTEDKVVPIGMIKSATDEKVILNEDLSDFDRLPPFEETHYVRAYDQSINPRIADDYPTGQRAPGYYWYPPHGYIGYPAYGLGSYSWPPVATMRNIPEDAVALQEGSDVMSSDGEHVGDIERLLLEPETNKTTHFVISQGLLFKDRKMVPASWVRSIEEDKVQLTVSSQVLENLPPYEA